MKLKEIQKQRSVNIPSLILRIVLAIIIFTVIIISVIRYARNPENYSKIDVVLFLTASIATIIMFLSLVYHSKLDATTKIPTGERFTFQAFRLMLNKKLDLYAVLFMNIKNFKHINRIVGNRGGNEVLAKYAKKINDFLLPKEYVGRMGGDNFVVLVYKHRLNEFVNMLQNMTVNIGDKSAIKELSIYTRAGIYTLSERDTISELFNYSSTALAYAKNSSNNDFVWFQKYMLEQTYEEKEIAYLFMNAVQNKDFKVYYQPRINIETQQVCGGEALVRWNRNGKIYMPDTFLDSLERSGLISTLDFYVMEQVCEDLNTWKSQGIPLVPISSNFSRPNLHDKNFVHKIMSTISKHKIDTNLFQVEITESASEDLNALKEIFEQLHISDISTLVDDFGVGGFSWTLLKDPNVDGIKLDKSIIENIEVNGGANDDALLARNIIHACRDLRKEVICEGVENAGQRDMLLNMRCSQIQGFLFDEPLTMEDFQKVLEKKTY